MEKLTPKSIQRSRVALEAHNMQVPGQDQPVPEEEIAVQESEVDTLYGKGKRTTEE